MGRMKVELYTCNKCKAEEKAKSGGGWGDDGPPDNWTEVKLGFGTSYDLCGPCSKEYQHLVGKFIYGDHYRVDLPSKAASKTPVKCRCINGCTASECSNL